VLHKFEKKKRNEASIIAESKLVEQADNLVYGTAEYCLL
jgi:hypothetical protein